MPGARGGPSGSNGSSGLTSTPQLVSLSPSGVSQGSTFTLHLIGQGTHWQNQTSVSFGPQITVQSFTADPSGTSAVATINVAGTASLGARSVMLMSGTEMVGLPSGLTVTPSAAQQGNSGSTGSPMRDRNRFWIFGQQRAPGRHAWWERLPPPITANKI